MILVPVQFGCRKLHRRDECIGLLGVIFPRRCRGDCKNILWTTIAETAWSTATTRNAHDIVFNGLKCINLVRYELCGGLLQGGFALGIYTNTMAIPNTPIARANHGSCTWRDSKIGERILLGWPKASKRLTEKMQNIVVQGIDLRDLTSRRRSCLYFWFWS